MLRLYKPIDHDIFSLHTMLEHLVCDVWCEANNSDSCESKLNAEVKIIYDSYGWLKKEVDDIYNQCKVLSQFAKIAIKHAFTTNNKIEELCNSNEKPIYLDCLPDIVEDKMKPLLVEFYEVLLERAKVPGTKQDYYQKLIEENELHYCPCCGLSYFESEDSKYREAFDHYLPKSKYPFLSVNFGNLVPLCYKCNSDRKGTKDPIEGGAKAFYPFGANGHSIQIDLAFEKTKDIRALAREDLEVNLSGEPDEIETWDRLFDIKERYNDTSRKMISKTFLQRIKQHHRLYAKGRENWTYEDTLDALIDNYAIDKYGDKRFLKIPILDELKKCINLIDVYGD